MEILDIYDDNGNLTGKQIERNNNKIYLGPNEHVAIVIIFIENSEGKFLMQKASKQKDGLYAATGGHVCSGETPKKTIIREVNEEIGIDITNDNIIYLGNVILGTPIRHMFYLQKDIDLEDIKIQKEEVEEVCYLTYEQIEELIQKELLRPSNKLVLERVIEYKNNH